MSAARLSALPAALACALAPAVAAAQFDGGIGTTGRLAASDIFISAQKDLGVNLTDYEKLQYLNRANCLCARPLFVRAVLLPSGALAAAAVKSDAQVSLRIGVNCDTLPNACVPIADPVLLSDFRMSGITATTDVKKVSAVYSYNPTQSTTDGGTPTDNADGCSGSSFGQTIWFSISTTGALPPDVLSVQSVLNIDPKPPAVPAGTSIQPANEALIVKWNALDSLTEPDLLGYQVLCTRADRLQVFATGTFKAAFDGCPEAMPNALPIQQLDPAYVCSDLLASTSYRLKILQNGAPYGVAVVAVDKQRNASIVTPSYASPVATRDFYYEYRHGDPQGSSTGGYCSVGGDTTAGATSAALIALGAVVAAAAALRPARRRRRPACARSPRRPA